MNQKFVAVAKLTQTVSKKITSSQEDISRVLKYQKYVFYRVECRK